MRFAEDLLHAPLPPGWVMVVPPSEDECSYFVNQSNNRRTSRHPADRVFHRLVTRARQKVQAMHFRDQRLYNRAWNAFRGFVKAERKRERHLEKVLKSMLRRKRVEEKRKLLSRWRTFSIRCIEARKEEARVLVEQKEAADAAEVRPCVVPSPHMVVSNPIWQ